MPLKSKTGKSHHVARKKEKRSKHFMKVYAPYIPLLLIVGTTIGIVSSNGFASFNGKVKSYAVNTTDVGLLESTNKARQEAGLPALAFDARLDEAAQAKANDMSARNYWSHNTPDGSEPWIFVDATGYQYRKAAENLAYGFEDSDSAVNGWLNSPGHRANMLDANVSEVGFGIAQSSNYQNNGPETVIVAMYAKPAEAGTLPATVTTTTAEPKNVSYVQSVTGGKAPWSSFIAGLLLGSIAMYLTIKHLAGLRRALRTSERFVVAHPLFDITLVALLALTAIVSQTVGTIQ